MSKFIKRKLLPRNRFSENLFNWIPAEQKVQISIVYQSKIKAKSSILCVYWVEAEPSEATQLNMNRTDGLVRRNKSRALENGTSEANSSTANSVDENDVIINDRENDIDDTDSKETRLTLMEEVLLLGLKDKEVNIQIGSK